jgi:ABC-type transporter Mla MlaB component
MPGTTLKLRFSFERAFRLEDAKRAAGQLEGAAQDSEVLLDLSRCAQVDSTGVALLSRAVARRGGSFQALGLTRHDLRILQYLGVSLGDDHSLFIDTD